MGDSKNCYESGCFPKGCKPMICSAGKATPRPQSEVDWVGESLTLWGRRSLPGWPAISKPEHCRRPANPDFIWPIGCLVVSFDRNPTKQCWERNYESGDETSHYWQPPMDTSHRAPTVARLHHVRVRYPYGGTVNYSIVGWVQTHNASWPPLDRDTLGPRARRMYETSATSH